MTITQKPKIAILSIRNQYSFGGVFACLKKAYEYCERYFEPTVFFLGFDRDISANIKQLKYSSSSLEYSYFGMRCVEIGSRWAFWEPGHYEFTLPTWRKYLADYDYAMVVSGTGIAAHPLALLNKKYIMWIGTPYEGDGAARRKQLRGIRKFINMFAEPRMQKIERLVLEKSSYTLGVSKYATQEFEKISGRTNGNFEVCGFPVSTEKSQHLCESKENFILAVGRFSDPRKNIDMLIRSYDRIYQEKSDLKLYVVGSKPSHEVLKKYEHLSSFDNIIFTGPIANDDLELMYGKAKLLLITSHQEGLGIVGLEALLRGTPVIATDCGGTTDYVFDGITGYLVDINDDAKMAERVLYLLNTPILYSSMAEAGRMLVNQHFSEHNLIEKLDEAIIETYPELETLIEQCNRIKPCLAFMGNQKHYGKPHECSGC